MIGGTFNQSGSVGINGTAAGTAFLPNQTSANTQSGSSTLAFGTSSGQMNTIVPITYTIAASGTQDITLSGSLTDMFGATVAGLSTVKGYTIILAAGGASSITIGGTGPTHPIALNFGAVGNTWSINSGGPPLSGWSAAGFTVASGTSDTVRITNNDSSNAAVVTVVFAGVH
ncbi:hypothetical protein [Fimbriiglobus ruber]|uniref:Uncharacterized protein n=1 Tax=Fimbriiglobus ruber TaxID=1908690 RepID=A0A225DD13_9BACT|nr:hypothetical protein [Fimbriiglobus ruber]OWK34295.1 hypothetical protein FRUB_10266 [Fimbriiglobus ruber]